MRHSERPQLSLIVGYVINLPLFDNKDNSGEKVKVFYGQEPPSGESTTTECVVNYQLLAVICWSVAQWGTPSCSRPQSATDNGVRDCRSKLTGPILPPPPSWAVPPELYALHGVNAAYKSQDLLHQPRLEHASAGVPDQRTAYAATQGGWMIRNFSNI